MNYIVLHLLNGRCVSRWDFGENIVKACEFYESLEPQTHQTGAHEIIVKAESLKDYYRKKIYTRI
jgi:hypothetical protein